MNFDEKKVTAALAGKGLPKTCAECATNSWSLVPGYLNVGFGPDTSGVFVMGKHMPTVGVICENCGYIKSYSAGLLGLT